MTSISNNNNYNSSYYQLPAQGSAAPTAPTNPAIASPSAVTADTSSYLLDLSPNAQNYLSGGVKSNDPSPLFANPTQSVVPNGKEAFTLTPAQQQQITAILAKYKDAPATQDTFNSIQDDLRKANLAPDQLTSQDQVKSFNATQVFLSALNGDTTDPSVLNNTTAADESTKSGNYMKSILAQWEQVSGKTISAATSTGTATTPANSINTSA